MSKLTFFNLLKYTSYKCIQQKNLQTLRSLSGGKVDVETEAFVKLCDRSFNARVGCYALSDFVREAHESSNRPLSIYGNPK